MGHKTTSDGIKKVWAMFKCMCKRCLFSFMTLFHFLGCYWSYKWVADPAIKCLIYLVTCSLLLSLVVFKLNAYGM